jgi:hypothetical protein
MTPDSINASIQHSMSFPHLPEDVRNWPTDPFQVLNVRREDDEKEIRRAYVRLIRHFKPEQHPERFRRIREAFDAILSYRRWFQFADAAAPAEEPVQAVDRAEPERCRETSDPPMSIPQPRLDVIWDKACAGDLDQSYYQLKEMHAANAGDNELAIRLYWLLAVDPSLDPVRHRCDWLVAGLHAHGLTGPCRELYFREIDDDPYEALQPRYESLLREPVVPRVLYDFVIRRWQSAAHYSNYAVIVADMKLLRPRLSRDDEETWVLMLLAAADQLAWFRPSPARAHFVTCCNEIENYRHLHMRLGESLARLDHLRELSSHWHEHFRDLGEFGELIPALWNQSPWLVRRRLLSFVQKRVHEPAAFLASLDRLQVDAPLELALFGQTLHWLWNTSRPEDPPDAQALEKQVLDFMHVLQPDDYPSFRPYLLEFCTQNFIAPNQAAEVIDKRDRDSREITLAMRGDWTLRYTYMAHELIWG